MTTNTTLLLVRPDPEANESWRGYILRLAVENGIDCPRRMLRLSEIDEKSMRTAIPDISHILEITAKPEHSLRTIFPQEIKNPMYEFLRHKVSKNYLRINSPTLCPECVKETGYLHARWDVQFMNVCHIHERHLITHCPSCKCKLSWYRKGLLTCRCGHDFADHQSNRASSAEVNFAAVLAFIVEGHRNTHLTEGNPIPEEFTRMGLDAFLGSINTLGLRLSNSHYGLNKGKTFGSAQAYEAAVKLLNNWEDEFKQLIANCTTPKTATHVSFRSSFQHLFTALFKKGFDPVDMEFIRNSFNKHIIELHGDRIIDVKTKAMLGVIEKSPRIVGINEASRMSGIMVSTLRRMIARGKIQSQQATTPSGRIRHQIDITSIPIKLPNKLGELNLRQAAKYVELPVSVLRLMKNLGYYESNHKTYLATGWAIEDLNVFKEKFESKAKSGYKSLPKDPVRLSQLLYRSPIESHLRAAVVGAIIDDQIKLYGQSDLGEWFVSQSDLKDMGIALIERSSFSNT